MFYLFLLAHLVADFVLQPYWLVVRKQRWDGLLIHGGIVLVCMLLLPLADAAALALWPAMLAITAVHIAADWWKVRYGGRIPGPPIGPFLLDQLIHVTTLCVVLGSGAAGAADLDDRGIADGADGAVCRRVCRSRLRHADRGDDLARPGIYERSLGRWRAITQPTGRRDGRLADPVRWPAGAACDAGRRNADCAPPTLGHPLDMPAGMLAVLCVGAAVGTILAIIS